MASSQVEIASSPFGSVLRDRNRGDQRSLKQSNVQTAFQKSLKALVRTHLQYTPCVPSLSPPKHTQKHMQAENFPPHSDASPETPNLGSVSSLVKRWKQFTDSRLNQSAATTCPNSSSSPVPNPTATVTASAPVPAPATAPTAAATSASAPVHIARENSVSAPAGDNPKETERPRVADVIRRLTSENQTQGPGKNCQNCSSDHEETTVVNDFPQVPVSPARIRGRQAYTDLLLQFERGRKQELDALLERQAVSKFSHKGRIQAMLRLRFLLGEAGAGYQQHSRLVPAGVQRHSRSESEAAPDSHATAIRAQKHSQNEATAVSDQHNIGHETAAETGQKLSSTASKPQQCSQNEAAETGKKLSSTAAKPQQSSQNEAAAETGKKSSSTAGKPQQSSQNEAAAQTGQKSSSTACKPQQCSQNEAAAAQTGKNSSSTACKPQQCSQNEAAVQTCQKSSSTACKPQQCIQNEAAAETGKKSSSTACKPQQCSQNEAAAAQTGQQSSSTAWKPRQCSQNEAAETCQKSSSTAAKPQQCSQNEAAAARDQQHSHSTQTETSQPAQGSAVLLLREKFDVVKENDVANARISHGVVEEKASAVESLSTSNRTGEQTCHQEVLTTKQQNTLSNPNSLSDAKGDFHDEISTTSSYVHQETENNVESSNGSEENENVEEQEANTTSCQDSENEISYPRSYWEELEDNKLELMETDQDWANEGELDEQDADFQIGTNQDWISDISRPRSDWETLRQTRYQEMLDPFMDKKDIKQLLERRSVSTFLSSSLRETMDQLMMSRVQRLPTTCNQHKKAEKQYCVGNRQTHPISHCQGGGEEEEDQEQVEEEEDEGEEEEEEEESVIDYHYGEVDDNEVSNDSDRAGSPFSQQRPSSQSSSGGPKSCNSSPDRSTTEMELVYDLRAHIELLHQEICELRKTLMNNCMNIQVKMQHSVKQEVAAAVKHSAHGVRKKQFTNGAPRKSRCRFCRDTQVDSILYRCGHMCACFNCARELQWGTGKCPICQTPILDVVRVHAGS